MLTLNNPSLVSLGRAGGRGGGSALAAAPAPLVLSVHSSRACPEEGTRLSHLSRLNPSLAGKTYLEHVFPDSWV